MSLKRLFNLLSAGLLLIFASCGGTSQECNPRFDDDCFCEYSPTEPCADPDDLDCYCYSGAPVGNLDLEVILFNHMLFPQVGLVSLGGKVTWVNQDEVQHTITFGNGKVDELLNPGASFTITTYKRGFFFYEDRLRVTPGTRGVIIVE